MQTSPIAIADTRKPAASEEQTEVAPRAGFRVSHRAIIAGAIFACLALSIGRSLTDSPGCDEGWFASPAHNLITKGHFGTTVIEQANLTMTTGIHQYTYWIMPLNALAQAATYKIFGFSLFSMRALSILFALVVLAAWYSMMNSLTRDRKVALLALTLIALDFAFIRSASTGRMDMMCAALNFAALAAYLKLRERNFTLGLFASHSLIVASGLTHPNGILGFASLLFLILYFDRRILKFEHLAVVAAPYLIGAVGYWLYVMNDPRLFLTQLSGNGGGRLWGLADPIGALKFEIAERYIGLSAGGPAYLKVVLVLGYIVGVAGALLTKELRRHKGYRALLIISAFIFAYFTLFEGTKLYLYLIHVAPFYAALLAGWLRRCWMNRALPRWIIAPAVSGIILVHIAGSVYVIRRDSYHKSYLPAVAFLNERAGQNSFIMGTSELSFGLARYDTLLDDKWLGYHTGRKPDFIVQDTRYEQEQSGAQAREPEIYAHISKLLNERYQKVYDQASYKIYARR